MDSYIQRLMTRITLFALLAGWLLNPAPGRAAGTGAGNSVLEVLVTYQTFDERLPWRLSPPQNRSGYGLVVGPDRILTTEDLVRQTTLVEVRRPGRASKFTALVNTADPQLNAALLTVQDKGLLPYLEPVVLATNLERGAETRIVQYEESGATQEGTGRIVELSVEALPAAPSAVLTCRVLSDLRVMNTGAPVFIGSHLAGLMMRYDAQRQSGFVLPAPILASFLHAASLPLYHAPPYAGFTWSALVDPVLRRYLGVPEIGDGIQIVQTVPTSSAAGSLLPNDVILRWDGFAVDNQGFYLDPDYGRLRLSHAIAGRRHAGETISVELVRSGQPRTVSITLTSYNEADALIPENTAGTPPDYLVECGFVLRELTGSYLRNGERGLVNANPRLAHIYLTRATQPERPGDRIVILSSVLPDPVNIGYQEFRDDVVTAVNGEPVRNLRDVARCVDRDGGITRLRLHGIGVDLALDPALRAEANARISHAYRIPELRRLTAP